MLTDEAKEMNEQKAKEFVTRVNILILTLSLKELDIYFNQNEFYQLLFSTYIKMIENDQDSFFIEEERKEKIIQSLERTKAFYDFESKEQLQTIFETMSNDDPTDFMLFPSEFSSSGYKESDAHICGLTVYKKNEEFLVMKVDKSQSFDGKTASYFVVPLTQIEELSNLFFCERDFGKLEPDSIFKSLKNLSIEVKNLAVIMEKQSTGNCSVSEVEASLRTVLFNCRTDLFCLNVDEKDDYITPKWNPEHQEPTLEMRKRFLGALKGKNKDWNQYFDYIFDYYLYRKGELVSDSSLANYSSRKARHRKVRDIFSMDTYIPEMLKNNGQILQENTPLLAVEIREIEPIGILDEKEIREIDTRYLNFSTEHNMNRIKMFKERLDLNKIQRAKDITESIISRLQDKNKEIETELQRREEIEKGRQDKKCTNQTFAQLASRAVRSVKYSHRLNMQNLPRKKVLYDELNSYREC